MIKSRKLSMVAVSATFAILVTCMSIKASAAVINKRLAGIDRYETAAKICDEGWTQSDYAVIATGENYPDALSAAPLAKKYDAPILLTYKDTLDKYTSYQLDKLNVKQVFIVGGYGVVSKNVEDSIKNKGILVVRYYGIDRYETAVKIADAVGTNANIVVATGEDFADALSIAPIAASQLMPILLVPKDIIPQSVKDYLQGKNISKTYVLGGSDEISNVVAAGFPNVNRIVGTNKYERNVNIINAFSEKLNFSKICIATGENFPDALSGSVLAAKGLSPVVLVSSVPSKETRNFLNSKLLQIRQNYIMGGVGAVSEVTLQGMYYDDTSEDGINLTDTDLDINNSDTSIDGIDYNINPEDFN